MEGLLIAAALAPLTERLPREHIGWRFPDATTFVLPFVPAEAGALWLNLRLPDPYVASVARPGSAGATPLTPFQAQLRARTSGPLIAAEQAALDRRFQLRFGPGTGFVPTPPVVLEVELTGRHANLVLCDTDGRILGVLREVGRDVNRHRQLAPGLRYRPPPPYQKLDPRAASQELLHTTLAGTSLAAAHRRIDGIGQRLAAAWQREADVDANVPLAGADLDMAVAALQRILADPLRHVSDAVPSDPAATRRAARLSALREQVRSHLRDRQALLRLRLADAERATAVAEAVARLRSEADLLLAKAHEVPRGATDIELAGFDGLPVRLTLDPRLDAAGNAQRRYEQARKRDARAERARSRMTSDAAELLRVEAQLAELDQLAEAPLKALLPDDAAAPERRSQQPGLRLRDPHGFEIVIGRNARENDLVTFKVARSSDVWLHAQGYHGAHVIIRADGREIPFDTVRLAAELAAGHSEAGQSDNVAVDYTSRKDVWRSRGMPAGAVQYARQRTLFVTPKRRSEVD